MKKSFNPWPLGICVFVLCVIGLIIYTIKLATANPATPTTLCGVNYQSIDEAANEIAKSQEEFEAQFAAGFVALNAKLAEETDYKLQNPKAENRSLNPALLMSVADFKELEFAIISRFGHGIPEAEIKFFLLRPHTSEVAVLLGDFDDERNIYVSEPIPSAQAGRYEAQAQVKVGDLKTCIRQEFLLQ